MFEARGIGMLQAQRSGGSAVRKESDGLDDAPSRIYESIETKREDRQ